MTPEHVPPSPPPSLDHLMREMHPLWDEFSDDQRGDLLVNWFRDFMQTDEAQLIRQELGLDDTAIPINWVTRDSLIVCRPDLTDRIEALSENDLHLIAHDVANAQELFYQISVSEVLNEFFGLTEPDEPNDTTLMSTEFTHRFEDFGLTDKETLWYRVSEKRFQEILHQPDTHIHEVSVSTNNYGEFLFVKVSRPAQDPDNAITFYGLGLHEQRDRWITGEWFWYSGKLYDQTKSAQVSVGYADSLIEGRKAEIAGSVAQHQQGGEGRFFETLADVFDDDGVMAEMEDLDNLFDDLGR